MKRIARSLLLATAMVGFGLLGTARAQTIVAGPATTQLTADVGERITIPLAVDMTGASGILLGAYNFDFAWNPGRFRYVSTQVGTFGAPVVNADSVDNGQLRLAGANASGVTGVVTLGSVTLEVTAVTSADSFTVNFNELVAAQTFQDLLPFLTVTSGSFCAGAIFGDLDGNGLVEAVDAQQVLMHSVGLAIADTTAGDVDGDAKVDPRDALIILSDVVGLDVSAFLVGQFIAANCTIGVPDAVSIFPDPLGLAPGDVFNLDAQVRDSNGVLLGAKNLVWSSSNTGIATVDSTGALTALATGTATITAAVAPGISGTAALTVGARSRWVVNPAGAQGQQSEVGSDLYPFSTIEAAVARASAGDTVFVHVGTYNEPLNSTKALTFRGDSGAAGVPTISVPNGSVGTIAAAGAVIVERFDFSQSASGLSVTADTLVMSSVSLGSLQGAGLVAVGPSWASLRGVQVSGVASVGILVDSAGVVQMTRVDVAGVEEQVGDTVAGIAVRADTVTFDTTSVQGIDGTAIYTVGTQRTALTRTLVSVGTEGIRVDSGITLDLSDSVVVRNTDFGGVQADVDTLRVTQSSFRGGMSIGVWAIRDSTALIVVRDSEFDGPDFGVVAEFQVGRGTVSSSTFKSIAADAIRVFADTLSVDSVTVVESSRAVGLAASRLVTVSGSRFVGIRGSGGVENSGQAGFVRITNTYVEGGPSNTFFLREGFNLHADSIEMLNDTVVGLDEGFRFSPWTTGDTLHWVRVRDSRVKGAANNGIFVSNGSGDALLAELVGIEADANSENCLGCAAVSAVGVDSVRVDSSRIHDNLAESVRVNQGATVVRENIFERAPAIAVRTIGTTTALVRRNQFIEDHSALEISFGAVDGLTTVDSNSLQAVRIFMGVGANDSLTGRIEVRDNAFVGDLSLSGIWFRIIQVVTVRSVLIENNTIDSVIGEGIGLFGVDSARIVGNTVTNLLDREDPGVARPGIFGAAVAQLLIEGNVVSCLPSSEKFFWGGWMQAGMGTFRNNTVNGCYDGLFAGDPPADTADVEIRGNTVTNVVSEGISSTVGGAVTTVGNVVQGGVGQWGIRALAARSARVDSNTVRNRGFMGIELGSDTSFARGNVIDSITCPGCVDFTSTGGIRLSANPNTISRVADNRVRGGAVAGIRVATVGGVVELDSNVITDNQAGGLVLHSSATGRFNSFLRNQVGVADSAGGSLLVKNNIFGNGFGASNISFNATTIDSTFWGDALGPSCDTTLVVCSGGSTGDSVSTNIQFPVVEADTVFGAPRTGPPLSAPVASRSPSLDLNRFGGLQPTSGPGGARPAIQSVGGAGERSVFEGSELTRAAGVGEPASQPASELHRLRPRAGLMKGLRRMLRKVDER